ncbi:MAG: hypothetical protein R3B82_03175 [Sandaracinaceae bacterium]
MLIGGPGTSGVLVAKRRLFRNEVPAVPGGGTVAYVNHDGAPPLLEDPQHREEGGTPAIVESIRAGLVFQLKAPSARRDPERGSTAFIRRAIESEVGERQHRGLGATTTPGA